MNEPLPGNLWEHPLRYVNTKRMEREWLGPFYANIMKTIYEVDKNHIFFFENVGGSVMSAGFPAGGPGADVGIPPEK